MIFETSAGIPEISVCHKFGISERSVKIFGVLKGLYGRCCAKGHFKRVASRMLPRFSFVEQRSVSRVPPVGGLLVITTFVC